MLSFTMCTVHLALVCIAGDPTGRSTVPLPHGQSFFFLNKAELARGRDTYRARITRRGIVLGSAITMLTSPKVQIGGAREGGHAADLPFRAKKKSLNRVYSMTMLT